MSPRVQVAPIIGLPQYRGWSQVAINSTKNFVCVFAIEGEGANHFGRDLVEKVLSLSPNSSVDLHQSLLDIMADVRKSGHKIQLSCGLFLNDKSTFACFGGSVMLKRNGQVGKIIQSENEIKIIEGEQKPEDIYVFSTLESISYLDEIKQKLLQNYETDTIITSIVPSIHSQENSSLLALAFVELQNQDGEQIMVDPAEHLTEHLEEIKAEKTDLTDSLSISSNQSEQKNSKKRFYVLLKKSKSFFKKASIYTSKHLFQIISFIRSTTSKDIYLGEERRKKVIKKIVVILVVLAMIFALIIIRKSRIDQEKNDASAQIAPILLSIEEAKTLIADNPIQARNITQESLDQLRVIEKEFEGKKYGLQIIKEEINKAEVFSSSISGLKELQDLPVFFDLRLVESNFVAQKSDLSNNIAFFLDQEKKVSIALNLENKQVKTYDLSSIDQLIDISTKENDLFILGSGIHYLQNNEALNKIKDEGDSNKDASIISSFGPYLYVFNPDKRNIYRYMMANDNSLSDPIGWLTNKQNLDFAEIKSMAVDGDLWLSTKNGQIKKYTRGEPVAFTLTNLPELTEKPLLIFTQEGLENLYLLEPEKNRLLILQKDGQFLKEVKSESLASATSFFVSENLGYAYAVSGSIIFEIKL